MNHIRVGLHLLDVAQRLEALKRSVEAMPMDVHGNTIMTSANRRKLMMALRDGAVAVDTFSILIDGEAVI